MAKYITATISPQANDTMIALRDGAGLTVAQIVELAINGLSQLDPAEARRRFNELRARNTKKGRRPVEQPKPKVEPAPIPQPERNDLGLGDDVGENPFAE